MEKNKKKIVIIENNEDLVEILRDNLLDEEFLVFTITKSHDALNFLKKEDRVDIVITDLGMPVIGDCELLEQLSLLKSQKHFAMVVMTGDQDFDQEEAKKRGCDAFLLKPFGLEQMLGTVSGLLKN